MTSTTANAPELGAGIGTISSLREHELTLIGPLDASATQAMRTTVANAVYDGPALILVDVTEVTAVTPSGLVGILECLRLARSRGGDFRLFGASLTVLDAQTVAGLTDVTRVYGSRQAAVEGGARAASAHTQGRAHNVSPRRGMRANRSPGSATAAGRGPSLRWRRRIESTDIRFGGLEEGAWR